MLEEGVFQDHYGGNTNFEYFRRCRKKETSQFVLKSDFKKTTGKSVELCLAIVQFFAYIPKNSCRR